MPLNKEQKKQLAKVRKLLSSSLWADVHQALVILTALNDPQLWALLGKGLSLASSWRSSNYIEVGIGEIKTRVKAEHRYSVALWAAREVGMLDQLTVLDLKGDQSLTQRENLHPLAGLKKLKKLNVRLNQSGLDLSPLASLPALEEFGLSLSSYANTPDLTPLASAPKLKFLELYWPDPKRLVGLTGAHTLETLILNGAEIADLSALRGLHNLKTLKLSYSKIVNLDPLSSLGTLEIIVLDANYSLRDIQGLSNLHNLRELSLVGDRELNDLSPLASLTGLKTLKLPKHVSFEGLSGMPSGESITCTNWSGTNLSAMGTLTTVKRLNLGSANHITSTAALEGMTSLESLSIASCRTLTDLSGLSALPALKTLNLSGCSALVDLSGLEGAPCLEALNLGSTSVVDVQALTTIKTLKKLQLGQSVGTGKSPFIDVIPLQSCTQLTELNLCGSKVSDKKAIALGEHLPKTLIIYGGVNSKKMLKPKEVVRKKNALETTLPKWTLDSKEHWLSRRLPVASLSEAAGLLGRIAAALPEGTPSPRININSGHLQVTLAVPDADLTTAIVQTAQCIEAALAPVSSTEAAG